MKYVKIGRLTKFDQRQLDKWIDKHTVKARPDSSRRDQGIDQAA